MTPHGDAQDLGHPGVALEGGHRRIVEAAHRAGVEQVGHGGVPDTHLTERGQHGADVIQESPVWADDQDALSGQPIPVGIEEPRRAVQSDGGFPGARGALDTHAGVGVCPDDLVLLGLDRGDDVPHRPHPGPLDLCREDRAARLGFLPVAEMFVLIGRDVSRPDPEPPPQGDTHRVMMGGAIEGAGDLGTPVDHQRVAVLVAHMTAADVPPIVRGRIEPPKEQRCSRVVLERLGAVIEGAREIRRRNRVGRVDIEGFGALAHRLQGGPCRR